jgi:ribosome maturation factor RimP
MAEELINSVKEISETVVAQENMFLVDVEVKHAKVMEIWILVDSESSGVNLDACSRISREIGFRLEEKGVIDSAYRLNVSSPGLSRPLTDLRQYPKNIGRTARVKYRKDDEQYETIEGILEEAGADSLTIAIDKETRQQISFSDVVETKIIPKI